LALILVVVGCSEARTSLQADRQPIATNASEMGDQAINPLDTSADKVTPSIADRGDIEADSNGEATASEARSVMPVRVTGVVNHHGKPVQGALVAFHGEYTAAAYTDEEGKFTLTTFEPGDGALAGDYVVAIEASGLPNEYANKETSDLTATVQEQNAPNHFEFLIED